MKKYIKPELDVIEIKASDIYTESGLNDGSDGSDFDTPADML